MGSLIIMKANMGTMMMRNAYKKEPWTSIGTTKMK